MLKNKRGMRTKNWQSCILKWTNCFVSKLERSLCKKNSRPLQDVAITPRTHTIMGAKTKNHDGSWRTAKLASILRTPTERGFVYTAPRCLPPVQHGKKRACKKLSVVVHHELNHQDNLAWLNLPSEQWNISSSKRLKTIVYPRIKKKVTKLLATGKRAPPLVYRSTTNTRVFSWCT